MGNGRVTVIVREISASESLSFLANEAKALTWDTECEHAVLELEDGRRVLVRGGKFGIDLEQAVPNDPFGRTADSLWVEEDGRMRHVVQLILHTHPLVTGPSDGDLQILELLGQSESLLFEIFGSVNGTVIRPKDRKR